MKPGFYEVLMDSFMENFIWIWILLSNGLYSNHASIRDFMVVQYSEINWLVYFAIISYSHYKIKTKLCIDFMYYYPQLAALFFVLSRVFWEKKAIYFLSVRAIKKRARKSRRFSKLFFRLTSEMRRVAIDLWRLDSLFRGKDFVCYLQTPIDLIFC